MTLKEANSRIGQIVQNSKTQTNYRLVGISKRWSNQGIFFQAELEDLKADRSICVCRLDDITGGGNEI